VIGKAIKWRFLGFVLDGSDDVNEIIIELNILGCSGR
jgi:hypothetical protein